MTKAICLLIAIAIAPSATAADRYKVEYFNCYLVGLYGVFDSEGADRKGWDRMVSRPYAQGAIPDLEAMVKQWNERGIKPQDEARLEKTLLKKFGFAFPESTGTTK